MVCGKLTSNCIFDVQLRYEHLIATNGGGCPTRTFQDLAYRGVETRQAQ